MIARISAELGPDRKKAHLAVYAFDNASLRKKPESRTVAQRPARCSPTSIAPARDLAALLVPLFINWNARAEDYRALAVETAPSTVAITRPQRLHGLEVAVRPLGKVS
jgi:hypothetical protein